MGHLHLMQTRTLHLNFNFYFNVVALGKHPQYAVPAALGKKAENYHCELNTDEIFPSLDLSHDSVPLLSSALLFSL